MGAMERVAEERSMSTNPPDPPAPGTPPAAHAGQQFVERMFSGFGQPVEAPSPRVDRPVATAYSPLNESKGRPGATYRLQAQAPSLQVNADSPALEVMTDLRRVAAVSIRGDATVDAAHTMMLAHRVRALFVVDDQAMVIGILTSTDLLGERPILLAQQRGVRHDEILVREVMTRSELLETMDFADVQKARVGDVIASFRLSGRQHALVIETASPAAPSTAPTVRGIFSLTQIARQLGLPPQTGHDIARTFAEIEAAIGAA